MDDQRKMQRFELVIPAQVTLGAGDFADQSFNVTSRNICAGGGYFITSRTLELGTHVQVNMVICPENGDGAANKKARVIVGGEVLRNEVDGMVVKFQKHFKMSRQR